MLYCSQEESEESYIVHRYRGAFCVIAVTIATAITGIHVVGDCRRCSQAIAIVALGESRGAS